MSLTYNARYKSIAPEDFQPRIPYAFTLNIKELDGKTIGKRVFEYFNILAKLKYITYELWFEFSKVGKLHAHGLMKIRNSTDIANFFAFDMCVLTTDFAFEIDTIGDTLFGHNDDGEDHRRRPPEKIIGEDHPEDNPEGKPIKDHLKIWRTYCTKSEHYMKEFMQSHELPWRFTQDTVSFYINNKLTPELKRFYSMA